MVEQFSKAKPDMETLALDSECEIDQSGIFSDPELIAAGWVRRHLVDMERARESFELYSSIGYEVKLQELKPKDFGPKCMECTAAICRSYVIVYTRKAE